MILCYTNKNMSPSSGLVHITCSACYFNPQFKQRSPLTVLKLSNAKKLHIHHLKFTLASPLLEIFFLLQNTSDKGDN